MKLRVAGSGGEARAAARDPVLLCCAYQRQRLYLFSRREPEDTEDAVTGRWAQAQGVGYMAGGPGPSLIPGPCEPPQAGDVIECHYRSVSGFAHPVAPDDQTICTDTVH